MRNLKLITGALVFALAAATNASASGSTAKTPVPYSQQSVFIKAKIREYFPEAEALMLAIANCESTGFIHWMPDGSLRPHSQNESSARGVFQILVKLHGPQIKDMGLDVTGNIDDYMQFARYLFETQGPKNAWAGCYPSEKEILAMS